MPYRKNPVKILLSAAAALALSTGFAVACGGPTVCTVKDPTGTPLHVRREAGGPILSTLHDGQKVSIVDHVTRGKQRWALDCRTR